VNRLSTIAAKIGLGAVLVILWFLTALTATAMFVASVILVGIFLSASAHDYLGLLWSHKSAGIVAVPFCTEIVGVAFFFGLSKILRVIKVRISKTSIVRLRQPDPQRIHEVSGRYP